MICPKCQSENLQFVTNSSGGGYDALSGCCGLMFLGPLGLLCGACDSRPTTEEFWICHDCGHKFSNRSAQKAVQEVKNTAETCVQYKKDLEGNPYSYYREMYKIANIEAETTEKNYQALFENLVEELYEENDLIWRYKSNVDSMGKYAKIIVILIIAGIIACAFETMVGVILIGIAIIAGIIISYNEVKLKEKVIAFLAGSNPAFREASEKRNSAKAESEYWGKYVEKVIYVEKHDEE